jgi:hypothetical protein
MRTILNKFSLIFSVLLLSNLVFAENTEVSAPEPNFEEISKDKISPETELALYRIHSHLKTCDNKAFSAARLGVLWIGFRTEQFNPRNFVNRNAAPANIKYLSELNQAAKNNPNCSALVYEKPAENPAAKHKK